MTEKSTNNLFLERYEIIKHIYGSQTKTIKLVQDRNTKEKFIMKTFPEESMLLLTEAAFMDYFQGHIGVPFLKFAGSKETETTLLVEYLGVTLEERFIQCDCRFSLKTVCMLALQILPIIKNYHEKGILYRNWDLKCLQFGRGIKCKKLFFNDLSKSKRYRHKKTFEHIENMVDLQHDFINMFSTSSAYLGCQLSRRDEIESFLLMMIYLLKGRLPWSHLFQQKQHVMPEFEDINNHEWYVNTYKLCDGIPLAFKELLENSRNLGFSEEPNYYWYIQKIKALMFHQGIQNDQIYDWMKKRSHYQKLRVSKEPPIIKIDSDKPILEEIYDPVAEMIDLDDLANKFKEFQQKRKEGREQILGQVYYKEQQIISESNRKKKKKPRVTDSPKFKGEDCSLM